MGRHLFTAFLLSTAGCGASGGTPAPSIDPQLPLASLSTTQKTQLCDWEAKILGGYGTTTTCTGDTGLPLPASQSACVSAFNYSSQTCPAIVQDEFNCILLLQRSPCVTTFDLSTECHNIVTCTQG